MNKTASSAGGAGRRFAAVRAGGAASNGGAGAKKTCLTEWSVYPGRRTGTAKTGRRRRANRAAIAANRDPT